MNAAAQRTPPALWITWALLVVGWICLAAPLGAWRGTAGLALVALGALLAIATMLRRGARHGLVPILAALVVTPVLLWYGGALPAVRANAGLMASAQDAASSARASASGASHGGASAAGNAATLPDAAADTAFRSAVTAYELSSAYATDAKAADALYKGQRLLLTGMIATLDADKNYLTMGAGDFPSVQVEGLSKDARATLRGNQQVTLVCNGAGASGGVALVDGCSLAR